VPVPVIVDHDPCGGPEIAGLQQWMKIEGKLVIVLGDHVTPHDDGVHAANPHMIEGSPWETINGIPVCRQGDHANCNHAAIGTQTWFQIS
jgi:uncharacterized Zn-binding protein involved in type VI secretion